VLASEKVTLGVVTVPVNVGDALKATVVPVPVVAVKSAGGTCVNAMIYPYPVYVPEAVKVIIVFEPDVVMVGLPVDIPEY
jgi:hypothetical protein